MLAARQSESLGHAVSISASGRIHDGRSRAVVGSHARNEGSGFGGAVVHGGLALGVLTVALASLV